MGYFKIRGSLTTRFSRLLIGLITEGDLPMVTLGDLPIDALHLIGCNDILYNPLSSLFPRVTKSDSKYFQILI